MEDRKEERNGGHDEEHFHDLKKCITLEKKNAPWMSVPQFGDWDQKGPLPDYSMDFSKIREMRKQNKREVSRASLGNEEELISSSKANSSAKTTAHSDAHPHHFAQDHSPTGRRSFLSYFNCCVKA